MFKTSLATFLFLASVQSYSQTLIPLSQIVKATPGEAGKKNIEIRPGEKVYIDGSVDVGDLVINGELHCNNATPDQAEVKARTIYVNSLLQCGTSTQRYTKKITFSLKHSTLNPKETSAYRGMIVNVNGTLNLFGDSSNAGYVRLNETAVVGQKYIVVHADVKWKVGDKIVVGPTSFKSTEGETFIIESISGRRINLTTAVKFKHWGKTENVSTSRGNVVLDQRAEVANLSRNILIQPDEKEFAISEADLPEAQLGAHVMVNKGGFAYVDSVELYRMGQAGVMARYPFHWHLAGDVPGQFIKNSSIHRSFQRCVTVHGTNKALVENNVCYDFRGHGYFLEDGHEKYNTLKGNLGIHARYPSASKLLLTSDNVRGEGGVVNDRFPAVSVFWISNPMNTVVDNVASGSVGTGFWMAFSTQVRKFDPSTGTFRGEILATPVREIHYEYKNNVAHSTTVGHTWDGAPQFSVPFANPNNARDVKVGSQHYEPAAVPVFNKVIAYKNWSSGVYFRGQTAVFENGVFADNGWSLFMAYNQIVKNSVVVGKSENFGAEEEAFLYGTGKYMRMSAGIVMYDGPFELINVDFVKFSSTQVNRSYNGKTYDVTPVPIYQIGGANKFTNITQGLVFKPEPLYRVFQDPVSKVGGWYDRIFTSMLKDMDGSLSGVAGGRLISDYGFMHNSSCTAKPFLKNLKVCSKISLVNIDLWNKNGDATQFHVPYVVRRDDGQSSIPSIADWDVLDRIEAKQTYNAKVNLVAGENYEYTFLVRNPVFPLQIRTIASNPLELGPVLKFPNLGTGCALQSAKKLTSLADLKKSTVAAYYTSGSDFYMRQKATNGITVITAKQTHSLAKDYNSAFSTIRCGGTIATKVLGNIDSVTAGPNGTTIIKGWACDYTKSASMEVQLYLNVKTGTSLGSFKADQTPDAAVNFACADPTVTGHRFSYTLSKELTTKYKGKKVFLYGMPTVKGIKTLLTRSGLVTVP